jgi:anti-sigma-K factor RskA
MRHWATSCAESVHLRAVSNRFALWRMAVVSLSISATVPVDICHGAVQVQKPGSLVP